MRVPVLLLAALAAAGEPVRWMDLQPEGARLLTEAGLNADGFDAWLLQLAAAMRQRLDDGSAEHIAYYLLQTRELSPIPALNPAAEARRFLESLPAGERAAFLGGKDVSAPLSEAVERRVAAFRSAPVSERHRILREMADGLGWPDRRILQTAFRFLMRRSEEGDADALYQERGLSADPFPPSMRAVERGLARVERRQAVLLIGPGAELGSRFGVDDGRPVAPPQPGALLQLLGARPSIFDCVDVRPEVARVLEKGPCMASTLDIAGERLPAGRYDLVVATNVFVYLDDRELGVALANIARALRPGGCLLHNDSRFAARLFGEAAGIPVKHYESVVIGQRGGREQRDRIAVHCRLLTGGI